MIWFYMNLKELHLADKWFKSSSYYIPNERSKKEQMTKYWEIQVCKLCRYGTYMDIDICFCSCLSHGQFISVFDECVYTHMCVFMALIHIQIQCKYSMTTCVRCKCVKTSFCIFCRGCVYVLSRGFFEYVWVSSSNMKSCF